MPLTVELVEELCHYQIIFNNVTKLKSSIFVDNSQHFLYYDHPLRIYAFDQKRNYVRVYVENGKIDYMDNDAHEPGLYMEEVVKFVEKYRGELIKIAKDDMSIEEFEDLLIEKEA